jgi:hypothetical protein
MSNLRCAVSAAVGGPVAPQDRAEVWIAVIGAAVRQAPDQHVVVVGEDLAGAQLEPAVGVLAVLQVERDGPAGARAAVGRAAVVGPAVVEAQMALGDDHRDLGHVGLVVGRVPAQHDLQVVGVPIGEVPGHGVIVADLAPSVTAVDHRDRAHFLVAVVKRDEGGQHPVRRRGRPVVLVEVPGHEVRGLAGDRRLVDQRRLEHADLSGASQGGGDRPDERLAQQPGDAVVLVVHVVVVPLHVALGRVPVGQLRRPQRQRAIALARVVPLARRDQLVDLVVGEQLLAEVPAVLGVERDIGG